MVEPGGNALRAARAAATRPGETAAGDGEAVASEAGAEGVETDDSRCRTPSAGGTTWSTTRSCRCRSGVPTQTAFRAKFAARRVESVGLPYSQVAAFDFSPMAARRSPAHIRRQDPEHHFLVLVREGAVRLEQKRGVACLGPGGMALFSTSHPLTCDFLDKGGPLRLTLLRLPRAVLPLPDGRADRMLAEPLPDSSGSGTLLGPYPPDRFLLLSAVAQRVRR